MPQTSYNNKRIAKNTLLLYFRMLITMVVSLYTSRVVLHTLGVSGYGLYNVVGGVVTMFTFINGTLASGTQRFLTFELGTKNEERLRKVFNTAMALHGLLACVLFVLVETIGLWFLYNKLNIESGRMDAAFWVFQFSCVTMIVNVIQVPFMSSIISHEKLDIYAYMSIFDVVMKLLIVYLIQVMDYDKLFLYGMLLLVVNCLSAFIYIVYCRLHFDECRIRRIFDRKIFKEMLNFSGWNIFGCAAVTFQGQGVNILLNIFFGTVVNAARGIAFQVNGIVMQFVNNFQTAVNPQIVKHYVAGEVREMVRLSTVNSKLAAFLLLFILVPLFIEIEFVLKAWLGEYPAYAPIFLRIILIQSVVQTMTRPLVMMIYAVGKMKLVNITAGGALLMILPVSYILLKLGASPVTVFIVNVIPWFLETLFELLCLNKYIGLSPLAFYKTVYANVFPIGILMFVLPTVVFYLMDDGSLRFTAVCIASILSSSVLIYAFGLDKGIKGLVVNKIRIILKRKLS